MISQDCGFDDLPAFRGDIDVVDPIPVRPSFPTTESTSQFHPRVQLAKGIAKRFSESFDGEIVFSSIEIPHDMVPSLSGVSESQKIPSLTTSNLSFR